MTFARCRNRLTTHFSERIAVFTQRMTVHCVTDNESNHIASTYAYSVHSFQLDVWNEGRAMSLKN